jgi:hypothetical protein
VKVQLDIHLKERRWGAEGQRRPDDPWSDPNVVFDVEGRSPAQKDPWGNTQIGLSATTRISRIDLGLIWNAALEAGGLLVGDAVTINLDVQLIKER